MIIGAFDLLLVGGLIVLAALLLFGADLFRSVVFFIVFGLLMALAWARLNAPDLALAEAIVGAGVTGGLLVAAWRRMTPAKTHNERKYSVMPFVIVGMIIVMIVLAGVLISTVGEGPGLLHEVMRRLPESGVRSPVTAVLLNFRGYDTLLELGVLLLAVASVLRMGEQPLISGSAAGPVLSAFASLTLPVLAMFAGYLLWRGGHAPGGAFQAGSLLGAAGILLLLTKPEWQEWLRGSRYRVGLSVGPILFLAVAMLASSAGRLLAYPRVWAGGLILLVEAAATLSIAAALVALFLGVAGRSMRGEGEPP